MVSTEGVAKTNPQVRFENSSGTRFGKNLAGFTTRSYQPRYLSGLIAGKMTQSGKIGYIASHRIPEVIRSINAFTLGVRKVNPSAEVEVQWTAAWNNPEKERVIAAKLIANGADVLTNHTDSSAVAEFAEANNVKVIGFHSDMSSFAPTQHLASVTHNWGPYYVKRVQALIAEKWQGQAEWLGMDEQIPQLSSLNKSIPADVRNLVAEQQAAIISGKLNVFAGPIKNTRGRVRVKEGSVLSDEKLLRLNWYVEGVTGSMSSF
jgi:basic membrane protein A